LRLAEFLIALRDRIVQRSQLSKEKLDAAFARRELDRQFQALGEQFLALARGGQLPVPPEVRERLREVEALESRLAVHRLQVSRLEEEAASST
jgi:hypothetical protein